jgi:hypothetical protein
MLKKSFAGHGPAPQKSQVIADVGRRHTLPKMRKRDFFSSLLDKPE